MNALPQNGWDEMVHDLRNLYAQNRENSLVDAIMRLMADPVQPQNRNGSFRPHVLIVVYAVIALLVVTTFIYFTLYPA